MDNLKIAIINAFNKFHKALENGRPLKGYEDIKEAICLENYVTAHEIELEEVDYLIERGILNLRLR
jgi:hypothetical protein